MNLKKTAFVTSVALLSLTLAACAPSNQKKDDKPAEKKVEKKTTTKKDTTKKKTITKKSGDSKLDEATMDKLQKSIKEHTKASAVNTLFENNTGQATTFGKVKTTLDGYRVLDVKDYDSANFDIIFRKNPDKEGIVLLAQYTITNNEDKDVNYMTSFYLSYPGAKKDFGQMNREFIGDKNPLSLNEQINNKKQYILKKGQTVTGYMAYNIYKDAYDEAVKMGGMTFQIDPPATDPKELYKSRMGETQKWTMPLDDKTAKTTEKQGQFIKDKLTEDNMGTKTMVVDKKDLDIKKSLSDVDFTVTGYQIANFKPNTDQAPRFRDFKNGITAVTIKTKIKNNRSEGLSSSIASTWLMIDDSKKYMNSGMVEPKDNFGSEGIAAGKEFEKIYVFLLDQEEYEKLMKDKKFELRITRVMNSDNKIIGSSDDEIKLELPK